MKNTLFNTCALFVFFLVSISCTSSDIDIDAPNCIKNKIEAAKNADVTNPPTQIWKWVVDSEIYYYITSDCCDQYNYLYNDNCEIVCAPDGGITGGGDGNCPEFNGEIVKTLVWKDIRN